VFDFSFLRHRGAVCKGLPSRPKEQILENHCWKKGLSKIESRGNKATFSKDG
jgi:hypothetical protein